MKDNNNNNTDSQQRRKEEEKKEEDEKKSDVLSVVVDDDEGGERERRITGGGVAAIPSLQLYRPHWGVPRLYTSPIFSLRRRRSLRLPSAILNHRNKKSHRSLAGLRNLMRARGDLGDESEEEGGVRRQKRGALDLDELLKEVDVVDLITMLSRPPQQQQQHQQQQQQHLQQKSHVVTTSTGVVGALVPFVTPPPLQGLRPNPNCSRITRRVRLDPTEARWEGWDY
ncbi:hypothetical protein Pmani_032743 [Petrolisthes manimaculis]|uniref:Uncharacterized protein n=1 Tax=Petrolisthes manimaculis TaxID=1843537 RepID=A0AAE1NR89_9EUCA|nr:hypothetical protein Pmani_032743 [Petrolisthes manimaculis]